MPLDFTNKKKSRSKPRPFLRLMAIALVSSFVPEMSLAQTEGPVTLRFEDGRGSLTGRLTAFRDDKWFIDSSVGWLVLNNEGVTCVGAACPPGTGLDLQNARVALTSKDGSVTIDGDLIEVDNDQYVLATEVGEQRIDVAVVDCSGAACPSSGTEVAAAPAAPAAEEPEQNVDDPRITLTSKDGSVKIDGDLVGIDNDQFVLATEFGEQRIDVAAVDCEGPACPEPAPTQVVAAADPEPVNKDVELSNGSITLVGELLDVRNGTFIIRERSMGDIRVSMADFACSGEVCP